MNFFCFFADWKSLVVHDIKSLMKNSMKKSREPKLIVLSVLLLPSLSLLLLAVETVMGSAQYVVPCHFNPMCSCKMSQTSRAISESDGYANEPEETRNRTLTELEVLLADEIDRGRLLQDTAVIPSVLDAGDDVVEQRENEFDVSCVGVPFAFLPGK
jgi:hypothetical protein